MYAEEEELSRSFYVAGFAPYSSEVCKNEIKITKTFKQEQGSQERRKCVRSRDTEKA